MTLIRPFVNFNFKNPKRLGDKNRGKINWYYHAISASQKQGLQFVKTRVPKRRKILTDLFGGQTGKEMKGAWVPVNIAGPGAKVKWKDWKPTIIQPRFPDQTFFPIDPKELAKTSDVKSYIDALIRDVPENALFTAVVRDLGAINARGSGYSDDKGRIGQRIADWVMAYGFSGAHDVSKWFTGLKIFNFADTPTA